TKTIYDPCPAGYTVPRKNAFTAFRIGVYDDGSGTYSNVINTKSHDRLRGYYCYTNWRATTAEEGTGEIYFPFFGRRTARSGAAEGMRDGRFHTAEPFTANNSMIMNINNGGLISPLANDVKVIGSCIRPQREETPMP
ncbi:MAG: hypothetical protein IKI67_03575, partial [Bacteroidales bacterium]|nr:hypothetical protein [Bacteroidales bacterium]